MSQFYGEPIRSSNPQKLRKSPIAEKPAIKLSHEQSNKTFFLENVDNIQHVMIDAPTLEYSVMRTDDAKKFKVMYSPKGESHTVQVRYAGDDIVGSPFQLTPRSPQIEFNHGEKSFSVDNVHDIDKLEVKSDTLAYEIFRDKDSEKKFHVKYEPNDEIHQVDVVYNDKPVEDGVFQLVPKQMREEVENAKKEHVANYEAPVEEMNNLELNQPNELILEHNPENTKKHQMNSDVAEEQPHSICENTICENKPEEANQLDSNPQNNFNATVEEHEQLNLNQPGELVLDHQPRVISESIKPQQSAELESSSQPILGEMVFENIPKNSNPQAVYAHKKDKVELSGGIPNQSSLGTLVYENKPRNSYNQMAYGQTSYPPQGYTNSRTGY